LHLPDVTEEIKSQMPIHIKLKLVNIEVPVADGGVVKGYVFDFF
jgi:osmotically-inducible protein OsmY